MELSTARLLLREFAASDAAAFLAYQADPRAQEFHDPADGQRDRLRELVALFMRWAAEVPRLNWQLAVADRQVPGTLVGTAGLRRAGAPPGMAEFGLELAPSHWGQGYATEAAVALLDFGFGTLDLTGVCGITISANTRVTRLVERLGFRRVEERGGAEWLAARGWREVRWELQREGWEARVR